MGYSKKANHQEGFDDDETANSQKKTIYSLI